MESPAPKRRRTSPRAAIDLPAPDNPESTTPKDSPPKPTEGAKRPSYASPTRASLNRHNPDILRRRTVSPKRKSSNQSDEKDTPLAASRPSSSDSLSQALAAHLATQPQIDEENEASAGPSNSQKDTQNVTTAPTAGLRSPARRTGSMRNPMPRTARPLPQPLADEDDDDLLNPFAGRGLARSPGPLAPEPELPPTPEHPDPVVSTPPSGIHHTPSKRPKRSKELAERLKSSSPLKQPAVRPSKSQLSKLSQPTQGKTSASPPAMTTAEMRGLPPDDPDVQKKHLRDWLLSQVRTLERELEKAKAENQRINSPADSKRKASPPPIKEEVSEMLGRHGLPHKNKNKSEPKVEETNWLEAALDPIAFLPFSKPTAGPMSGVILNRPPNKPGEALSEPTSHHPLTLTKKEALVFNQLFTPLTYHSYNYPLPSRNRSDPVIMRHSITLTPQGNLYHLFTAQIDADVNTKTQAIIALSVPRLSPAAVPELTPFIKTICSTEKPNSSALTNNISILGWSMSEWLRVALTRAKFWKTLHDELGSHNKENLIKMVRALRAGNGKAKRHRRRQPQHDNEDEDAPEPDAPNRILDSSSASELSGYMGQQTMYFKIPLLSLLDGPQGQGQTTKAKGKGKQIKTEDTPSVSEPFTLLDDDDKTTTLQIQWRIEFDWTGEARSDISLAAGVPGRWHQYDERGQLFGVSKLFNDLIQGHEQPLDAVRIVVSLLAGDPGPEE